MDRDVSAAEQLTPDTLKYFRPRLIAVAVVCLLVGGIIGYWGFRTAAVASVALPQPTGEVVCAMPEVVAVGTPAPTLTPQPVTVYVTGAVANPQVVTLPGDSLMEDALAAAGGAAADADLESLNLAAPVYDNQQLVVPRKSGATGASARSAAMPSASPTLLDLNTATAAELETLPRIGPTLAQAIVAYREANGPFVRVEDIQNVPGIGPATYEQIAPYLTVTP